MQEIDIIEKHKTISQEVKKNKGKREFSMKNKGITLIALVITIIIMLILASVTIATLTGENGIITKATEAKKETEKAAIEEQLRLAQLSAKIKAKGGDITIDDLIEELRNQGLKVEQRRRWKPNNRRRLCL